MERVPINFKRLSLTDIKIDIKRVPKKKDLVKAMEAAGRFSTNLSIYLILFSFFVFLNWICFLW